MKRLVLSMAVVPFVIGGLSVGASANGINIFNNVKLTGEIRPRYEHADQNKATTKAGNSYTARTSLAVHAGLLNVSGLSTFIQGTSVNNFGYTNYNSKHNGQTQYDVVVDPQQARITQAYVDYKAGKTLVRAGRQLISIDNQRFVGPVGWRQMFQTFDAATVVNTNIPNLTLLGSFIYGRNGVGYQDAASNTSSVVLHADYKVAKALKVTAYSYMLSSINNTYGVALTGKVNLSGVKLNYRLEYAQQSDPTLQNHSGTAALGTNGKPKADAQYYNINIGANISGILAGVDYESLGKAKNSSDADGFSTPLATLHKFNGLADVFLGRTKGSGQNTNGLNDFNAHLGYKAKGVGKLIAIYHKFNAQASVGITNGSKDLGSEYDVIYTNKIPGVKNLSGLIGGAFYKHGNVATGYGKDKTVAWLQLDYKFATN